MKLIDNVKETMQKGYTCRKRRLASSWSVKNQNLNRVCQVLIYLSWLQALLPVLREMGTPQGHTRQSSLETRLALIAAAPWKSARTGQTAGNEGGSTSAAAELQATSLLNFAWGFVFEAPGSTLHFLDIRHAACYYLISQPSYLKIFKYYNLFQIDPYFAHIFVLS